MIRLDDHFPLYTEYSPLVPVYCITPSQKPTIHRFYDTSPISPSGRYFAATEFPFENQPPKPGDSASVVVIDLNDGHEVYRSLTAAWDTQLGAQVQWGTTDSELFFNRMNSANWIPYGVKIDISNGQELVLEQTVYMVAPDGQSVLSPCLRRIAHIQPGYGVIVPDLDALTNRGAPNDDGIYIADTTTGHSKLLLSIDDIVAAQPDTFSKLDLSAGGLYVFHVKWNPQSTRIMFVMRWVGDNKQRKSYLLTCTASGEDIHTAINAETWQGGHHPNWCPDGEHIIMNLVERTATGRLTSSKKLLEKITRKISQKLGIDFRYNSNDEAMRFYSFRYDGTNQNILCKPHFGSGHPTLSPDSKYILTDSYPRERVAYMDGSVPLRWINLETNKMQEIVRINSTPSTKGPKDSLRIDPHPAWVNGKSAIVFNGSDNGSRRVYIALLRDLTRD